MSHELAQSLDSRPNEAFNEWSAIFNGESTIISMVLDRVLHHAETVLIEGSSYRMQNRVET